MFSADVPAVVKWLPIFCSAGTEDDGFQDSQARMWRHFGGDIAVPFIVNPRHVPLSVAAVAKLLNNGCRALHFC